MNNKLDLKGLIAVKHRVCGSRALKTHTHSIYANKNDFDVFNTDVLTQDEITSLFENNYGTVTITQKENETITVTCNGTDYTATFKELIGYPWVASVVAASGYVAGELSGTSGKVIASVEITVGNATEIHSGVKVTYLDGTVRYFDISGEIAGSSSGASTTQIDDVSNARSVALMDGITSIGDYAFYNCIILKSITISNSVTSIGESAFHYCSKLSEVTIPDSVTNIGISAFERCGLLSVVIPSSITTISDNVFYGNEKLVSITIPSSVTTIGSYVFCYDSSLSSVIIPSSVSSIGSSVFGECTGLTSVTIEATTPPTINGDIFYGCTALTEIKVPSASLSAYQSATNWSKYASIMVEY